MVTDFFFIEGFMEKWKWIKGYKGSYQVSNRGRVLSVGRMVRCRNRRIKPLKDRFLKLDKGHKNYPSVRLSKNKVTEFKLVHRLVAVAFIPNPEGKAVVNHKDGNKTNNRVSNLEWCTVRENAEHAVASGLSPRGAQINTARLTEADVRQIRKEYTSGTISQQFLATRYGLSQASISFVILRKSWGHVN